MMSRGEQIQSSAGTLDVRLAGPDDVDDVVALYVESNAWIRAQGFDPGEAPRPLRDIVADRIATRTVYVARLAGEPIATLTLLWQDREAWGETPDDAVYLHGFSVGRAYAGRGIGRALLDWTADVAAEAGRAYVRLDCMANNRRLRDYYERAGFTYRGDMTLTTYTGSRYEKPVGAG
jgi:ribosomal protein S18 acetylase RimI-like enzyme